MKTINNTVQLTLLTLLLLFSFSTIAKNSLAQQLDEHRPDNISDSKWQGLKAAVEESKISSRDGVLTNIGYSISLDPILDRAVLGAPTAFDSGENSGLAYVFEIQNHVWVQTAKLQLSNAVDLQRFGTSVAIDGHWIAVGAPNSQSSIEGAIFTFFYDGNQWIEYQKLVTGEFVSANNFGQSVKLVGNRIWAGEPLGQANNNSGAVYMFDYDSNSSQWQAPTKIVASDGESSDRFGFSIDIDASGTRAVIGAVLDDDSGFNAGAIYIFDLMAGNWIQSAKLTGSEILTDNQFGAQVAISGDVVIAKGYVGLNEVYVFEKITGTWQEVAILSDSITETGFGRSIDVYGNTIAVGRFGNFPDVPRGVIVYTNEGNIWTQTQSLTDAGNFGLSDIDIQEDRMMIGDHHVGAGVYENIPDLRSVHKGSNCNIVSCTWTAQNDLLSTDSTEDDAFGVAIDVSGNKAIIGAFQDDDKGNNAGAAYIYEFMDYYQTNNFSWMLRKKLTASDGEAGDGFGRSVAIDGNKAVVGAYSDDHYDLNVNINVPNAGSVYVFNFDGLFWFQSDKLTSEEGVDAKDDFFGFSVDIDNASIVVGAHFDDENGTDTGAAYVFNNENGNWQFNEKLMPLDSNNGDAFGYAVSIYLDRILIGAYLNDEVAANTGAAYIYQYDTMLLSWQIQDKLLPAVTGTAGDYFGTAVSLDGDNALVGAFFDDTPVTADNKGSVYYYQKDSSSNNWNQHQVITASDGEADDRFGYSVSLKGNKALIGSWLDDDNGLDSGSVYMFDLDTSALTWTETEKIIADDGNSEDYFGVSVALSNTWMMVGAHRDNTPELDAGAVYVYIDDVIFKDDFEWLLVEQNNNDFD